MDWFYAHWSDILAIYGAVVALASIIVKLTPSTRDDEILGKIIAVLDVFSTEHKASDAAILDSAKK